MKFSSLLAAIALAFRLGADPTSGALRPQASQDAPETVAVAEAARMLVQGNLEGASALASRLYTQYPKSPAVASLVVQTTVPRNGALSALTFYERWLPPDGQEQPEIVRFLALSFLREAARDVVQSAARLQALDLLTREGDQETILKLQSTPDAALTMAETSLLAARGDERAVRRLVDQLQNPIGNKRAAIAALGRTHLRSAVTPLAAATTDPDPVIRLTVAQALGTLGLPEGIPSLKPLLNDPVFTVHLAAATALVELKDDSGLPWLREVQKNPAAGNRLAGLSAMKSRPDAQWLAAVRDLTTDSDPEIRREAAGLLAPHDPDAARTVLKSLMSDPNPAERLAAQESLVDVDDNLSTVRSYLHSPDTLVRVRAAARLLELTR
jgi:HEAT repeat protein